MKFATLFSAFSFAEPNWGWHLDGTSLLTGFSQSSKVLNMLSSCYIGSKLWSLFYSFLLVLVCTYFLCCNYMFVRVCTAFPPNGCQENNAAHIYMDLELPCKKVLTETSRAKHCLAESPRRLLCWVQLLGAMFQTCNYERSHLGTELGFAMNSFITLELHAQCHCKCNL